MTFSASPESGILAHASVMPSDLMRHMLHSWNGTLALQKGIASIRNYIDIYRLGFDQNFLVNFKTQVHLNGL